LIYIKRIKNTQKTNKAAMGKIVNKQNFLFCLILLVAKMDWRKRDFLSMFALREKEKQQQLL